MVLKKNTCEKEIKILPLLVEKGQKKGSKFYKSENAGQNSTWLKNRGQNSPMLEKGVNILWSLCDQIQALDRFKHRISEVFTSGDVSLHNIVIFLSYKPSKTCDILLWKNKADIRAL